MEIDFSKFGEIESSQTLSCGCRIVVTKDEGDAQRTMSYDATRCKDPNECRNVAAFFRFQKESSMPLAMVNVDEAPGDDYPTAS